MRRVPSAALLLALLPACSAPQDHTPVPPCPSQPAPVATATAAATAARDVAPAPDAIKAAEGRVTPIAKREDIALTGPRVDAQPGDLMLTNGAVTVTVTQEGRVSDFGANGGRDELVWLNPTAAIGLSNAETPIKKLGVEPGDKVIRVERDVAGKPLVLVTWVYLTGPLLRLVTLAQSTSDDPAMAITLGERVSWGNVPTWLDGHGFIKDAAKVTGGFLARDALGVAYGVCSESGPLFAKFDEQELPGFFEAARTGESVVLVPAHGQSAARSIAVSTSSRSLGDAVMALPCGPKGPRKSFAVGAVPIPRARLEVARCDANGKPGKPFLEYRGQAEAAGKTGVKIGPVELPEGCFRARLTAPGHAPGAWAEVDKLAGSVPVDLLPKAGTLSFTVAEGTNYIPARLVVRGEAGTKDPDWGDDAGGTGAASNVLASESGAGEAPLPPGKYRVLVTRGFEYSADEHKIEVKAGGKVNIKAQIQRVVDTKGWIAADLHLHAVPSSDAPSLLTDRIRSLVASGIEAAAATDHNAVTDYRPAIEEIGQQGRIKSIIGDEITTRDMPFGHFNAFPLEAGAPPIPYKDTLPASIFAAARASKPYGKDTIVQVNHPRMGGIGYFELLRFDVEDIPAWLKRSPLADVSFDALEVFNGDHYTRLGKVEECLKDWYALLNAGYRPTATGNSDSHRVSFQEPGVPRNLVQVEGDDPAKLDERAFISAVRAGKVVVSSGPFVTIKVGDKGVGDTIAPGEVEITARVDGPEWVDITEVTLVKRGDVLKSWTIDAKKQGKRPWQLTVKETLKAGDWVIAIARGKKPMEYLYRTGAAPFGFTNPIFVK